MPDFRRLIELYKTMEFTAADKSNSVIQGNGKKSVQDSTSKTQQIAAYGMIITEDRVKFLIDFLEIQDGAIKSEVERVKVLDHQCYSGKDNKCVTCGKDLSVDAI